MVTRVKGSVWNSKDNSLPANVVDYGADPTGVADSATAIQNAINENSSVYIPTGTYRVDTMITIGDLKSVELGGNCSLMREDTLNGDPVIWMNGQYSSLRGQGQTTSSIGTKARCSEGVVRIGQPNMVTVGTKDISYNTVSDLNISGSSFQNPAGPYGQTTGALDVCLHIQAPELVRLTDGFTWAVYFNNIMNLRLTDANIGLYLHGFANGNLISNIHGFRLGNTTLGGAMILDEGSLDNNLTSLFHHKSDDTTTIEMKQLDNRNLTGTYSQSGGTAITITIPSHKLLPGESINLNFTSGSAVDGVYTVATVPDVNTFTVTAGGPATTSGNVTTVGTNTSIPAGYQGNVHKCLYTSYRGVAAEQGGTAVSIKANDGSVTACFIETRDNVAGGNLLDAGFLDRNWFFSGTAGSSSSNNRFAAYASAYGVPRRSMDDQNGGQLFDEYQWSIGNMVENSFYNVAEITFDNNHESVVVEMSYAMKSASAIAADAGGKVTYFVKKNSAGVLSAEVLTANYRSGNQTAEDVAPLVPYIPSTGSSGTTVYFGFRTFNNSTGGTDQDLRINARVQRSEISASVAFTPTTSTTLLVPIAPDTTANFIVADDDSRGREMTDQRYIPFLEERYHVIRSMGENTTYRAVEVTFSGDQQSATVEIDFVAGSGSLVDANGGGKVVYTMVKNASGVVSADARLARYVPSTISPCAPQISGDTVTIPFLTYNNGTATTVQRLHMKTTVNTSNGITNVAPTFYESAVTAASGGTPVSNTL